MGLATSEWAWQARGLPKGSHGVSVKGSLQRSVTTPRTIRYLRTQHRHCVFLLHAPLTPTTPAQGVSIERSRSPRRTIIKGRLHLIVGVASPSPSNFHFAQKILRADANLEFCCFRPPIFYRSPPLGGNVWDFTVHFGGNYLENDNIYFGNPS